MKKKLKIIHVLSTLDFGGVESRMLILAKNKKELQHEHHILALGGGDSTYKSIKKFNFPVNKLNQKTIIPSIKTIWILTCFINKSKPDVIHTHGAEANFHGIIAAKLAGVKVIIGEEIGIPSHSLLAKLLFKYIYKLSSRVIGISDSVKNWLVKSKEVSFDKAIRVYNPVDIPIVERKLIDDDIFRIGYIGRLATVKNPMVLVKAVHHLIKNDHKVELSLVGDGELFEELNSYIIGHKLQNKIFLLGFKANPMKYIEHCDLYVQPSISEGFGLAIVEAMGCGLPVAATKVGGVPEIITTNVDGWIIDASEPCVLAASLLEIITLGKEKLQHIGSLAKHSVTNKFTCEGYIKELEKVYEEVFCE